MDFIDEEDISVFERIQDTDDLRRFRDRIPGYRFDIYLSLLGDDVCHCRLSESAGAGKEDMADMSFPFFAAFDSGLHDSFDMFLPDEFLERIRSSAMAYVHQFVRVDLLHFHDFNA